MEQIKMVTTPAFKLTHDELSTLYLRLALFRFPALRNPEYNEGVLLARLTEYFRGLKGELNLLAAQNKTNLAIHELNIFFDLHYHNLLELKALAQDQTIRATID